MKPVVNVFNVGWVSDSVTHHSRRQGRRLITGPRSKETSSACRFGGLRAVALTHPTLTNKLDEYQMLQGMSGYVLEQPVVIPPPGRVMAWGYFVVATGPSTEPERNIDVSIQPQPNRAPYRMIQIRPVGRLVPLAAPPNRLLEQPLAPSAGKGRGERDTTRQQLADAITLRPVQSGQTYRITSSPVRGLVRPELAEALETVFERFSHDRGFTPEKPLEIRLSRGFQAGSPGHGEGRAADVAAVDGKSLLEWKQEWDRAIASAEKLSDPQQQADAIAAEQKRNLGYGLYKALQEHNGWRVDPKGWRPYRGVMQLFGPWTATEGPWKAMQIKEANPYQRQRLADQQWVFRAHQDHVHVAR